MDVRLNKKLMDIEKHLDRLRLTEEAFLFLEAHSEVLPAQLFVKAEGRSIADKEAQVYSSQAWIDFSRAHAQAKSDFNHARRQYELLLKKFDGAYLSLKTETPVIRRQA